MKSLFKKGVALCGSAMLAIAGSLVCVNINHRTVHAEEFFNRQEDVSVYRKDELRKCLL